MLLSCRFEFGLEKPDPTRALHSTLTIAGSYMVGGMIPLLPYILIPEALKVILREVSSCVLHTKKVLNLAKILYLATFVLYLKID
jgi:hypothetical protein